MSTTWEDVAYQEYLSEIGLEEYEEELKKRTIEELPLDKIRFYLGTYGDAIEKRVNKCINDAKELMKMPYYGSALVRAVTAIEVIIRYYILKPLLEGTFLSDQLSRILIKKMLPNRSYSDRNLLIVLTKHWDIPLANLKLSNDRELWNTFLTEIIPKRNNIIHKADEIEEQDATNTIECVELFMKEVIAPLAKKFGFGWPESGQWCKFAETDNQGVTKYINFKPKDPFT